MYFKASYEESRFLRVYASLPQAPFRSREEERARGPEAPGKVFPEWEAGTKGSWGPEAQGEVWGPRYGATESRGGKFLPGEGRRGPSSASRNYLMKTEGMDHYPKSAFPDRPAARMPPRYGASPATAHAPAAAAAGKGQPARARPPPPPPGRTTRAGPPPKGPERYRPRPLIGRRCGGVASGAGFRAPEPARRIASRAGSGRHGEEWFGGVGEEKAALRARVQAGARAGAGAYAGSGAG